MVYGTLEQCREQIEALIACGADHLPLNPVAQYKEQLEAVGTPIIGGNEFARYAGASR